MTLGKSTTTYLIRFVCSSYFRKIHLEKFQRGRTVNEKQTFPDKAVQSQVIEYSTGRIPCLKLSGKVLK